MKVKFAINTCYGGFGLEQNVQDTINALKTDRGLPNFEWIDSLKRTDKEMIEVIEKYQAEGIDVNDTFADVQIIEVEMKDPRYELVEYDGLESINTPDSIPWDIAETPELMDKFPQYYV
jgi:hypothetical protein